MPTLSISQSWGENSPHQRPSRWPSGVWGPRSLGTAQCQKWLLGQRILEEMHSRLWPISFTSPNCYPKCSMGYQDRRLSSVQTSKGCTKRALLRRSITDSGNSQLLLLIGIPVTKHWKLWTKDREENSLSITLATKLLTKTWREESKEIQRPTLSVLHLLKIALILSNKHSKLQQLSGTNQSDM